MMTGWPTVLSGLLHPSANIRAFTSALSVLKSHRVLALEMARREITDRYSGQVFGALWAFGHPLFMIGLYVFIFGYVFKIRIGGTFEMPLDYTAYILAGLIPWMSFQEAMNKASTAVTGNAALVKQVVFPLEVLPAKGVLTSLLNLVITLVLLTIYILSSHGALPWTYLLVPVLIALQATAMMGVSFILSALGVFFRDTKDLIQIFGLAGMYLVPVVYLPTWVPAIFKPVLYINPFSYLIWCYQDALYFGRIEHPWAWVVVITGTVVTFMFGFRLFRRLKPFFGNML